MADPTSAEPNLPARVQARVVALTAEVLPQVVPLPGALRRVAAFAPARRARSGGAALWSALQEAEFRERVGVQVAAMPVPTDPGDAAAVAWLTRGEGWREQFDASLDLEAAQRDETPALAAELERVRAQTVALQAELRDERSARREHERELRAEIAELRRKVGQARAGEREA
ncbi:MAG: hypothetical protein ACI379_09940, partial [Nocardioides sp.]|uniref:hypothetical protein n=1 Tax=Nocardioides sp. TaxID=35761 RepID=UPI003EFDF66B